MKLQQIAFFLPVARVAVKRKRLYKKKKERKAEMLAITFSPIRLMQ